MTFSKALFTLTPAESKRLIARAVVGLPEVKTAYQSGKIVIGNGTTTGYVVEELLQKTIDIRRFPSGVITGGVACQTPPGRLPMLLLDKGRSVEKPSDIDTYPFMAQFMEDFTSRDVFIKGANAVDPQDNVGFLIADPHSGTLGVALPVVAARKAHFIVPVGLEKLVASVPEAARAMPGIYGAKYSLGRGCGYIAVSDATVITEREALHILTGVEVVHVGSGGIGGSEGAVVLVATGEEDRVGRAAQIIHEVKGEPRLRGWKMRCRDCWFNPRCSWRELHEVQEEDVVDR